MKPQQRGFTLIELAIVMLLLTILAAGVLVPLTSQIESSRIKQTNQNLSAIQDALIGYAMSHPINITCTCSYDTSQPSPYPLLSLSSSCTPVAIPGAQICAANSPNSTQPTASVRHYLPCPNYDGTGIEAQRDVTGQCINPAPSSSQTPLLPWATLGLPTDAWGNNYGYDVRANYANSQIGFGANNPPDSGAIAPPTCPSAATPDIHIYQSCTQPPGPLADSLVAGQLAAVVISFGPNGWGAYNPGSHPPGIPYAQNKLPTTTDEVVNASTGGNGSHNYVSHPATDTDSPQKEFDDIVVGLPYAVLLNRVCPPGGCP